MIGRAVCVRRETRRWSSEHFRSRRQTPEFHQASANWAPWYGSCSN